MAPRIIIIDDNKSRSSSRSGRRRGKTGNKECLGRYGQNVNPFFNFLLSVKQKYKGLSPIEVAKKGAELWNKMTCAERKEYDRAAWEAQRKRRERMDGGMSRRPSRGESRELQVTLHLIR